MRPGARDALSSAAAITPRVGRNNTGIGGAGETGSSVATRGRLGWDQVSLRVELCHGMTSRSMTAITV